MEFRVSKTEKGIVLVAVAVVTLIFTLLGFSLLNMVSNEIILVRNDVDKTRAFYLAEAGVEKFTTNLNKGKFVSIGETMLGKGGYHVDFYPDEDPPYAVATGTAGIQEKRIKVTVSFLAPPYECGIYAGGMGGTGWTLMLRGEGNPQPIGMSGEVGGRDIVNGNVYADGDVALYQESSVNPAPWPNDFGLNGDVSATGDIDVNDSATISGDANDHIEPKEDPDLVGMNYAVNNTHNVTQIFADAGVTKGKLPFENELRDVFQINPGNMTSECASTPGDDYFLTPSFLSGSGGTWKTAPTPLDVGEDRVYYIDGDLWIHSKSTFGFKVEGKSTIVVTGNIHISDNTEYADASSMLGLVALGKYDEDGDLISGGNVYFGDPVYGTLYTCSAMMFAANNFLYNTTAIDTFSAEPQSGFTVNGNISALNRVSIERDWYTRTYFNGVRYVNEPRPAQYDSKTNKWYDSGTGVELTTGQVDTLRHYQMIVNYDDRVRDRSTQPPGLPRGVGLIFDGLTNWEELP